MYRPPSELGRDGMACPGSAWALACGVHSNAKDGGRGAKVALPPTVGGTVRDARGRVEPVMERAAHTDAAVAGGPAPHR